MEKEKDYKTKEESLVDIEEWPSDEDEFIEQSIDNLLLIISQEQPDLYELIVNNFQ